MPNYDENKAHYISSTAIIIKEGKYLIAKRDLNEKNFPGLWTVPGGKFETDDYMTRNKDTKDHWYNVLEDSIRREVKEEVNLEIKNFGYVTSLVYVRHDNIPQIIISLSAEWASGEVKLGEGLIDYKWVSLDEAKDYELIEGIYEELEMLDRKLKGQERGEWARVN